MTRPYPSEPPQPGTEPAVITISRVPANKAVYVYVGLECLIRVNEIPHKYSNPIVKKAHNKPLCHK